MKKLFLTLSLVVFLFGFVGCEKSPVEMKVRSGGDVVLGGEEIDLEQSKFLDTIFSERNDLIPQDEHIDSNIYVINSLAELNLINPFGYKIDIDWSKYTLVGGRITTELLFPDFYIPESLEEQENAYLLNITIDYSKGGYTAIGNIYFWRLYPKLEDGKNVALTITRIPVGG